MLGAQWQDELVLECHRNGGGQVTLCFPVGLVTSSPRTLRTSLLVNMKMEVLR